MVWRMWGWRMWGWRELGVCRRSGGRSHVGLAHVRLAHLYDWRIMRHSVGAYGNRPVKGACVKLAPL
jgi:hypothetical protein